MVICMHAGHGRSKPAGSMAGIVSQKCSVSFRPPFFFLNFKLQVLFQLATSTVSLRRGPRSSAVHLPLLNAGIDFGLTFRLFFFLPARGGGKIWVAGEGYFYTFAVSGDLLCSLSRSRYSKRNKLSPEASAPMRTCGAVACPNGHAQKAGPVSAM